MRLKPYLKKVGQTYEEFARVAGLNFSTVAKIAAGGGASAKTAIRIIRASRGRVRLEDLTPEAPPDPDELEEY